ncbi:MAG: VanW family protein [bacterium]|nr:VanW family protein [bacterium]
MRQFIWVIVGLGLVILITVTAFELAYWQKIYPPIMVGGVVVGNLTPDQASQKLAQQLIARPLLLKWQGTQWTIFPSQIGLEYDSSQSAKQAYLAGRQGSIWTTTQVKLRAFGQPLTIDPVFSWNENQLVAATASISAQINIPARESEVQLDGKAVIVLPGENGQAIDERDLRQKIKVAITALSADPIDIPVTDIQPKLTAGQAEEMRQRGEKLLNKKLVLVLEQNRWTIDTDQIFSWMDASGWNRTYIEDWVNQLILAVDRPAQNALFKYVGEGKVEAFQPARDGLTVKKDELVNSIATNLDKLPDQESLEVDIPVARSKPQVATAEVNDLGIKELIGRGESDYSGSIANRIFNLKKAAAYMNGVLIAPGEVFSFNKYVGDISTEGGYKQAYVIKGGKTILGDGGGVCQVSTTMFRAALNVGLPIVERTAHAYRVHYYEQDSGPGYDATIFTPSTDFKFKNDTSAYILIQTKLDEPHKKLAFEFYGTSDGRQVSLTKPKVWDVAAPPPDLYTDDPTLPPGTVKQIDWKAWGAKASFDYKVTRNGEVLQSRTFYSSYRPWQAVYLRGPVL